MLRAFWKDDTGFVISTELVLVATIVVIGLITGLVEVNYAVVGELNDVSEAIGSINQSYSFSGFSGTKSGGASNSSNGPIRLEPTSGGTIKAQTYGSIFVDHIDACDGNECTLGCDTPSPEASK